MNLYDIAYWAGLAVSSPYWLTKSRSRQKVWTALANRNGRVDSPPVDVLIHAVSVGEVNATRELIAGLRGSHPGAKFAVSVTTQTGFNQAQKLYASDADVTLLRYPLDFSSAVHGVLDTLRPKLVILMELEVWPNFMRACQKRSIPVVLLNGRITPGSFRRYKLAGIVTRKMFARLSAVCAQEGVYAERFIALGALPARTQVTGTMKFDTAVVETAVPGAAELSAAVGLEASVPIWVCGSTGPGEEQIVLEAFSTLRQTHNDLRLVIVPRKPERFDEVATLIRESGFPCVRRSQPNAPHESEAVVLGDTMGELRKFYSLATVVFVGRSLVDLGSRQHGSDMIEPAALAKPVVVGPFTANFAEPMNRFLDARAIRVVASGDELRTTIDGWLTTPGTAQAQGAAAQRVVTACKGATAQNLALVGQYLRA